MSKTNKEDDAVYIDGLTGKYNRKAYDVHVVKFLKRLDKIKDMMIVRIRIKNATTIISTYGNDVYNEIIQIVAIILEQTVGEISDVYRTNDDEFTCIAKFDARAYISQFEDEIGFELGNFVIPIIVSAEYAGFIEYFGL